MKKYAGLFTLGLLTALSCLYSQNIDPFYSRLYHQGEQYFLEKNYKEAMTTFEIAAFGLSKNTTILAKIYTYMSLCAYYQADREKSRHFLQEAAKLAGEEGLERLDILKEARTLLSDLLITFNFKEPEDPYAFLSEKDRKKFYKNQKKELEQNIKKNPDNVTLYYRLYDLHRKNDKADEAVKTLKKLIKENPNTLGAYQLLGKIEFFQNSYSGALEHFKNIIDRPAGISVDDEILLAALVYSAICYYQIDNADSLKTHLNFILSSVPQKQLDVFLKKEKLEWEWKKIIDTVSLIVPS